MNQSNQSKKTEKEKLDKSALKTAMLAAISEELDLWLEKEETINDGYEYESEFIQTMRNISHTLLSKRVGAVSSNRNKKKTPHVFRHP
jgi:hypothetical protein